MKHVYFGLVSLGITIPILLSTGCSDDSDYECPDSHDYDNDGESDCHEHSFFGSLFGNGYRDCPDSHDKDNDGHCDCRENDWDYIVHQAWRNDFWAYSGDDSKRNHNSPRNKKSVSSKTPPSKSQSKNPKQEEINRLKAIRRKALLLSRKRITVGFSSRYLASKNVNNVYNTLHKQAFTKISTIPLLDIDSQSKIRAGSVKEIYIGDTNRFEASDKFPYDMPVKIYYHDKIEINLPFSSKNICGKNIEYIVSELEALGFSNIYLKPIKNFIANLIYPKGSIRHIYINGNDSFKKNSVYKFDTEIIIEYHEK